MRWILDQIDLKHFDVIIVIFTVEITEIFGR